MKKFGEGQQPFYAIVDIPEGDAQELTTVTDQALNSLYGELFNLLQAHGINPTTTTSADLKQVARAVWSAVSAGNFYIDSGSENVKQLTHSRAANYLFKNTNANDDGFVIEFLNKVENTGAVTVNVFDVENNNNHFNNIPLVDNQGNQLAAKALPASTMIKAYFDYQKNQFIIINIYNSNVSDSLVFNAENKALRGVTLQTVESVADLENLQKIDGRSIYVKSYHAGLGKGGGLFIYDDTKKTIDDKGVVIGGWVRQYEKIYAEDFGAYADGLTDDSEALQLALNYCASKSIELNFNDYCYLCAKKITVDGAATGFRAVRLRGTYSGTAVAAGYAPDIARSGTVILTKGNDFIEVWFRRFFNENASLIGLAIVNKNANYPDNVTGTAVRLKKGDYENYPQDLRYITGNVFNDISVFGFDKPFVFAGNYNKTMAGVTYLYNFFGCIDFNRLYVYACNTVIVAENSTLNRLFINSALFFNINGGAIITAQSPSFGANSTEQLIMMQLQFVHFEDCRGMFRLGMNAAPNDGAKNHVTMIDVTREVCGIYNGKDGSPYGVVNNSTIHILGRHDFMGYLETSFPNIGENSEVFSNTKLQLRIAPNGAKSLSPDKINVKDMLFDVPAGGSVTHYITSYEDNGYFDLKVRLLLDNGLKGVKVYNVAGYYAKNATTGNIIESGVMPQNAGLTVTTSIIDNEILRLVIENTGTTTVKASFIVEQNYSGMQINIV